MIYRQADFAEVFEMKLRFESSQELLTFVLSTGAR